MDWEETGCCRCKITVLRVMTDDKLLEVLRLYETALDKLPTVRNVSLKHSDDLVDRLAHVKWCAIEAQTFVPDRRDKAFRWLGYIQGYLNAVGLFTVQELKEHSRPNEMV